MVNRVLISGEIDIESFTFEKRFGNCTFRITTQNGTKDKLKTIKVNATGDFAKDIYTNKCNFKDYLVMCSGELVYVEKKDKILVLIRQIERLCKIDYE